MSLSVDVTEVNVLTALRSVLLGIMPAAMPIVRGQANRVPEVASPDFVTMWPIGRERISTNVDSATDLAFTASIAGPVMTVSAVSIGSIINQSVLAGANVVTGTVVVNQLTGPPGGVGTYTVAPSQTAASALVWGGFQALTQPTHLVVQLDVHGPASADNATVITTVLRDALGVDLFAAQPYGVTPLYCDDPRQLPFFGEQQQAEERWSIDAHLQFDPTMLSPQQFASVLALGLIEVDANYPP